MVDKLVSHVESTGREMLARTILHLEDVCGHIYRDSALFEPRLRRLFRDRNHLPDNVRVQRACAVLQHLRRFEGVHDVPPFD